MVRQEMLALLETIVRRTVQDRGLTLDESTSLEEAESWDSLVQVQVMVALEGELGILFDVSEMAAVRQVSELLDLISAKLVAKESSQD